MSYKSNIVKKPWGYEYLVYENNEVAIWFLFIKKFHSTSLHCHPKKTTGLILLDGEIEISHLNHVNTLIRGSKMMIRKGLFHSTKALSEKGAFLFEIETPVDKHDLVRFKDSYGREGKPYEDSRFEIPKLDECLWINNDPKDYLFSNCILSVKKIKKIDSFLEIDENFNVMFLSGGLQSDDAQFVAGPGDIVKSKTIKELTEIFKKVDPETLIMTITPHG